MADVRVLDPLDYNAGEDRQQLSGLQGYRTILAEDPACLLQQPWPGRCETPVEERAPSFGLPRFSEVRHPVGGDSGPGPGLSRWAGPR